MRQKRRRGQSGSVVAQGKEEGRRRHRGERRGVRLVAGRGEEGSRSDALWGRERKADAGWGSARPRAAGLRCGPRGADREADARAEARGVRAEPRAVKPRDKSFLPTKFFLLFILFSSRDYLMETKLFGLGWAGLGCSLDLPL
jgi:hypothetical protein